MTNAPHDALFKTIFGQPEHAAAELQHILPGHIAARIDWSSLTPQPGTYVDEELADQHSDLLLSAATRPSEEPVFVYVLFEHQSSAQPRMALRLLRYMVRIWTRHANEHPEQPLPLIIPAVLAHVPGGWTAPTRFAELFSASVADIAPGLLPAFQYAVDDLHHSNDADLRSRTLANAARLSLWLLRDARDRDALASATLVLDQRQAAGPAGGPGRVDRLARSGLSFRRRGALGSPRDRRVRRCQHRRRDWPRRFAGKRGRVDGRRGCYQP